MSEQELNALVHAATELKSVTGLPWLSAAISDAYPGNRRVQFDLAEVSWRPQPTAALERLGLPNLRRACALAKTTADRSKFSTSLFTKICRSNDLASISEDEHGEALEVAGVALEAAETTGDKVEILLNLGEFLYETGEFEACLRAAESALDLDPNELRAHGRAIRALEGLRRFDDEFIRRVEEHSRRAFATEHDSNALTWAWLIYRKGHPTEALVGMERHMPRTERWGCGWWARLGLLQLLGDQREAAVRSLRVAESKWGDAPKGGITLETFRALIGKVERGTAELLELKNLVLTIGI